jgi:hypothetical protein
MTDYINELTTESEIEVTCALCEYYCKLIQLAEYSPQYIQEGFKDEVKNLYSEKVAKSFGNDSYYLYHV